MNLFSNVPTTTITIGRYILPCSYSCVFRVWKPWNQYSTKNTAIPSPVSGYQSGAKSNAIAERREYRHKEACYQGSIGSSYDVVSSNAMLTWYARNGRLNSERKLFDEMPQRSVVSWNAMISRYAKNGKVDDARLLFDKMLQRDVVSWNGMITGYTQNGRIEEARELFDKMPQRNVVSWTAMITGYVQRGRLDNACELFDKMVQRNVVSWTAMMTGYVEAGRIEEARQLFDEMPVRDVVTWTSMIAGYAQHGRMEDARHLFDRMLERNVVSWTALVSGYAQNGHIEDAREMFDQMPERNDISWTAMITGYAQSGRIEEARRMFDMMPRQSLIACNAMITGYAQNGLVDDAHQLFERLSERNVVSWTAMLTGFAQSGRMEEALQLFEKMSEQTTESWTAIIKGYAQNGFNNDAIKLFSQMQMAGVKPNQSTLISVLTVCASLVALEHGKQVHDHILKMRFELDVHVGSILITMYVKCGSIGNAQHVFNRASKRDLVLWNAMISGFAQHGHGKEALKLFQQMQQAGMKPDKVTFVGVLSACRHAGLVIEGWRFFDIMRHDYHISPTAEHCASMVDLLGRFGSLEEAEDFINNMHFEPDAVVWGALLGACRIHLNLEIAERAAEHLFELEPQNAGTYVLMSNLYVVTGRWDNVAKLRQKMKNRGIQKVPGSSWIQVNNKVHAFLGGDRSHSQTEQIYGMLESLAGQMEEARYVPDTNSVLHDVNEEEKKHMVFYHSEKLAIAFGIISVPIGTPIRVIKNLRMCGDCHTATKFISKIVRREIVVRDANRFHHFKDGDCSCGDYW